MLETEEHKREMRIHKLIVGIVSWLSRKDFSACNHPYIRQKIRDCYKDLLIAPDSLEWEEANTRVIICFNYTQEA